ncbi:WG repeat-containing protein [Holospora curviuscula]|uniref:KWG Leptospira n=1 Tax=Holospora curviuscula TaxID=1082868 RepID=A0A2S5R916_9PROT|nr:WG repeat-containing protein [Holospora curviuscula]PPE03797.1 KWG Leptospira [Holospora curviuscula]
MRKKIFIYTLLIVCAGCDVKKTPEICATRVKRINLEPESYSSANKVVGTDPSMRKFTDPNTGLMGFKNKNGKIVIPAKYRSVWDFSIYGVADVYDPYNYEPRINEFGKRIVKVRQSWYKINKFGDILVKSYLFDNGPDYYVSGLSRFEANGKMGCIDLQGKIAVPPRFDWITPFFFSHPIAIVCVGCRLTKAHKNDQYPDMKGGKWGAINKKGEIVIPMEFTDYKVDHKDRSIVLFKGNVPYNICLDKNNTFKTVEKDNTL